MSIKDRFQSRLIDPIKRMCPPDIDESDFLRHTFNIHTRTISGYWLRKDIDVPGVYLENDTFATQGVGDQYRPCKKNSVVLVRSDITTPGLIHVDNKGHIFQLTQPEWVKFRVHLRLRVHCEEV